MSLAPVISDTGISAPSYSDILVYLQDQMRSIYGSDIDLDADTQDGQFIAVFALAIKSQNDAIVAAYNSFSPATAQGVGLSSVVKINGMRRLSPSNGTIILRISGTVGTQIGAGQASDDNQSVKWNLPAIVTIPIAGFIDVTATADTSGNFTQSPGTVTKILTPTRGWQSVTNPAAATPGDPIEDDATLRIRQSVSTSIPALSVVDAILGGIRNLTGVGRATIYENATGTIDANGVPGHTISAVVEGGDVQQIANTIALYKTPGTGTYGTTSETVVDDAGITSVINFYSLALSEISIIANITAGVGFVITTAALIQQAVQEWINSLNIGQDPHLNKLWAPVNLYGDAATTATGQTQAQLDLLSATYDATSIYMARSNMTVTGGPYLAGATVINVTNTANYAIGNQISVALDDGSAFHAVLTNVSGTALTFTGTPIPVGRQINNGTLVYVSGNIIIAFNEAADVLTLGQVTVNVS